MRPNLNLVSENVKVVSSVVVMTPALGMNPHSCFGEKQ